ncbi:hemerythrin domain-containing protein [Nostocoides sp. F2B08]|uniref:hemerythrin domain-containing protein n=1 Tax=Nostocoides sp. F2B08 TaxID=2653936 RepID=UPI001263D15D|nr:hemerythrin domain-containing protein [Tetrasphaera sp. F2B08]KAB7744204.1 hemerythrin domain-containing protein [Tetrasphaera sp. F2B08]
MCSYCGCRDIGPIGDLTREHEFILNTMGEVRRAVGRDDLDAAADHLTTLMPVLILHDTVEELAIYPSMKNVPMLAEKVAILFDEHDEADQVLDTAIDTLTESGPTAVAWAEVLRVFAMLWEHIDREENGLFPAAAIAFETEDWERAEQVRARAEAQRTMV